MATSFITHVQAGTHAARPAASAVPQGTLYACSTHGLIYQSDGSSTWSEWYDGSDATSSFGSNVNAVSTANAPGSSNSNTRSDHVHLGVTSVSHASNTFSGPVILTASGVLGITVPTPGTFNLSSTGGSGSGSTADHNHTAAAGDGGDLDAAVIDGHLVFNEEAAPSTPASGTIAVYAKSDGRLYSKDDAGTEYGPFSSGSGALVGERKAWDNSGTYPLHTDGSEFEYADLTAFDAFWTRRNVATGDVFNPPGSHTEFKFDAQGDAIYRAMTFPTDGWLVAEFTLTGWSSGAAGDQDNMFGLAILDTSGNGMGYAPYQGLFYNINVTGWAYASFGNSATPSAGVYNDYLSGGHVWLGLERISSTQYRGAHSTSGTAWDTRPTANTPTAFTPAYICLVRMFSSGAQNIWRRVHRVNIYSVAFP